MDTKNKNTFCVLPWLSIGTNTHGTVRACGRSMQKGPSLKTTTLDDAWNSNYFKTLRLDMLQGNKNINCTKCYEQENLGGKSKRIEFNNLYPDVVQSANLITDSDGKIKTQPSQFDIRVGNICNLKCTHCWTGNSTKWYEDKLLLDKYENTQNLEINNAWIDKGEVWEYLYKNIKQIEKISFLGGEPFASKYHNKFIHWCAENNPNISLNYVTNATLLSDELLKSLFKFKTLVLGISLDAVEEQAEFLRFPTNWKTLYPILKKINSKVGNSQFYFNFTCHALNILSMGETKKYCETHFPNIRFHLGDHVINPVHMSVQNLPENYKKEITKRYSNNNEFSFYINYMNKKSLWDDYSNVLLNYLNDLDTARNTNWKTVLPEIAGLYE